MKPGIIYCVAFLCTWAPVCGYAAPSGVVVLSGEQRVWGFTYERIFNTNTIVNYQSYDSGTVPWNGEGLSGSIWIRDRSPGYPYYPYPFGAQSDVDALYVHVDAIAYYEPKYEDRPATALAYGEGTWVFQPQGPTLRIEKDTGRNYYSDDVIFDLDDLSTGESLLHFSGRAQHFWSPYPELISVDPTHDYRMHIYLYTSANGDGWYGTVRATVIPAPGAMVLGMIGAGLVGYFRRRRIM